MAQDDRPTAKQQRYLRSLADKTGTTFTPPRTRAEAADEIDRLKRLRPSARYERSEDRSALARAPRGGSAAVRKSETDGYGSSARWAGRGDS